MKLWRRVVRRVRSFPQLPKFLALSSFLFLAAHGSTIRVYLAVSVTSPTRYLAVIPSGVKMTWLSIDHSCDLTSLVHTIDLESVL